MPPQTDASTLRSGAPYWLIEGYGVPFEWSEYQAMADTLRGLKGKVIVNPNNHPDIHACFAGFHPEVVPIKYHVGGGGKQGERTKVLIFSWGVAAEPARLF